MKTTIMLSALILAGCQTTYEQSYTDFDDIDDAPVAEVANFVETYICYGIFDHDKKGEPVYLVTMLNLPAIGYVEVAGAVNPAIYESKRIKGSE